MKKVILFCMVALVGCNGCREKEQTVMNYDEVRKEMVMATKARHQDETKRIKAFIAKKKWPMTETKTGLQYWIYERGKGTQAKAGDVAVISYDVELLDGTPCYSADSLHPGKFVIGEDHVESGLHEALLLMHTGDKARLVLPSHLAFGFTGDSDKIPSESSLVYDIQLLAVE